MGSVSAESQGPLSHPRQNFDSEICGVVSDAVWDSWEKQQHILQMAIVEHLYQRGMLSVAEELCQVTARRGGAGTCLFCFLLNSFLYITFLLLLK